MHFFRQRCHYKNVLKPHFIIHLRSSSKTFTEAVSVEKCFPFSSFFVVVKEEIVGSQIQTVGCLWYHSDIFLIKKCDYTMSNIRPRIVIMQFTSSDVVWSLFWYVILHELLQDCNVVLHFDGGFYWTHMSVYGQVWYHLDIFLIEECSYTIRNMRPRYVMHDAIYIIWFGLVTFLVCDLHELLQDCNVVLRVDGGFYWTHMSVYGQVWYHLDIFLIEECSYTMHNMRPHIVMMQFTSFDVIWSLFWYMILHELLQDCDVVLRFDGGFYWTHMSVYGQVWYHLDIFLIKECSYTMRNMRPRYVTHDAIYIIRCGLATFLVCDSSSAASGL